jgi:hypothetical protein
VTCVTVFETGRSRGFSAQEEQMKQGCVARILDREEYPTWDSCVLELSTASPYHNSRYLECLAAATDAEFRLLGCFLDGQLVGGIPLYKTNSRFGTIVTPRSFLYYNGPWTADFANMGIAKADRRKNDTLHALSKWFESANLSRVRLKLSPSLTDTRSLLADGWRIRPTYTYVVALADLDALWDRMDRHARRMVARAKENGLFISRNSHPDKLFEFHEDVHKRKGAPLYLPREKFTSFVQRLISEDIASVHHAHLESGEIVASQLVLGAGYSVAHTICAGSAPQHDNSGSNAFLRWEAFRYLAEKGTNFNDLTDAALNTVSRFKASLGADVTLTMVAERPDTSLLRLFEAVRDAYDGTRRKAGAILRGRAK